MTTTQPPATTGTSLDDVRRGLGLASIVLALVGLGMASIAFIGSSLDREGDEFGLGFFVAGSTGFPALLALVLGIVALRSRNVSTAIVAGVVGVALAVEPVESLGLWTLGLLG